MFKKVLSFLNKHFYKWYFVLCMAGYACATYSVYYETVPLAKMAWTFASFLFGYGVGQCVWGSLSDIRYKLAMTYKRMLNETLDAYNTDLKILKIYEEVLGMVQNTKKKD